MQIEKKELLTPNEVTFILIGIMLDVTATSLPNNVVGVAKQDGWISVLIGAIYPLYVVLIVVYVSGKFPKENILVISKRYMGKTFGTILNLLFLLSFFSFFPPLISTIEIIVRTEALPLLTPIKINTVLFFVGVYAASLGIKVLGRICSLTFWMVIVIIVPTISILNQGSLLNIGPIFGTGIVNILKGSLDSTYDYSLLELIFLIYPFINDSRKIKSSALKAVGFTAIIYTWITFITIYYMGKDIIPKTIWSFFTVTEAVQIEVVNNFRYIFVFFWMIIAIKSVAIFNYVCMFIVQDIKKIRRKKVIYVVIAIVVMVLAKTYYGDVLAMGEITKYTSTISVTYNLVYITLIASLIWLKRGGVK
ncbi:GerAB/ArcD/ProY family transporter [Clostridium estertheticum]|uniref:GerAB/ArcD/ProY family transporter n=1 Tax=Clostridium estertheticum TaxID=238834 RepID=UPI001CF134D1|nr:GerAB/ArcD/ProY family transporter [Clostridium estertheticum]MCB2352832.1 spore germination protein [Clostridium estertheticum]WAG40138.1 spore germination protein [Clostridium estertheticum]